MTGTITVEIPVQFRMRGKKGYVRRFGVVDVELVTADAGEAPLAMRWAETFASDSWMRDLLGFVEGSADTDVEDDLNIVRLYRVYDGFVWEQAPGIARFTQARVDELVREGGWREDAACGDVDRHPFVNPPYVVRSARWAEKGAYRDTAHLNGDFVEAADAVTRRIADYMIVDGLFWRRSFGPVIMLYMTSDGPNLEFSHRPDRYSAGYLPSAPNCFDPFDIAVAEDFVARHYGPAKVSGSPPERLNGVMDIPFDPYPAMAEVLACNIMDTVDKSILGNAPLPLVRAVTALRSVAALRWPDAEKAYTTEYGIPGFFRKIGHGIPEAPTLVYAIGEVLDNLVGTSFPVAMVREWRATYDRIRPRGEDADAFDGIDFG